MRKTRSQISQKSHVVLFLPGLGADHRIFQRLQLRNSKSIFLDYIPAQANESLNHYAIRLCEYYGVTKHKNLTLVGVSFGGIIAQEIASKIPVQNLVLVSSFKRISELPLTLRLLSRLGLESLLPAAMINRPTPFLDWLFTISAPEDRILFHQIVRDTDVEFFRWALRRVSNWKPPQYSNTPHHLHGDRDRLISHTGIKNYERVQAGGHLMVLTHAPLISEKLNQILTASFT